MLWQPSGTSTAGAATECTTDYQAGQVDKNHNKATSSLSLSFIKNVCFCILLMLWDACYYDEFCWFLLFIINNKITKIWAKSCKRAAQRCCLGICCSTIAAIWWWKRFLWLREKHSPEHLPERKPDKANPNSLSFLLLDVTVFIILLTQAGCFTGNTH